MKTRECDVGGAVRLPKQFYERPLTLEESRFASEHISIVYRYLRQQGLNSDEWFDVVIFRYLLSVKRYFALPELQKYNEQHPKGYDAYRVDKCIYIIRGAKVK